MLLGTPVARLLNDLQSGIFGRRRSGACLARTWTHSYTEDEFEVPDSALEPLLNRLPFSVERLRGWARLARHAILRRDNVPPFPRTATDFEDAAAGVEGHTSEEMGVVRQGGEVGAEARGERNGKRRRKGRFPLAVRRRSRLKTREKSATERDGKGESKTPRRTCCKGSSGTTVILRHWPLVRTVSRLKTRRESAQGREGEEQSRAHLRTHSAEGVHPSLAGASGLSEPVKPACGPDETQDTESGPGDNARPEPEKSSLLQ